MELPRDLLRTLVAAVDAGTLDGAAHALALTPSAVSQRIRALERQLGRVLLTRTRPVRPTPDGTVLLRLGRQLALLEHEALAELGAEQGTATMRLGVNADSLASWFLPAVAAVASDHDVVVELHREDQERTAALLESGTVMGAVTAQREPVPGCVSSPIGGMRYVAAASPAFAERWLPDGGTAAELARAPYVDFDDSDVLQARHLAARGVTGTPPRHLVSASAEFGHAIELGLGWGMLLPSQLESGAFVALDGDPIDVPLHWQRWNLSSTLLDAITDAVVAAAKEATDIVATPAATRAPGPRAPRRAS
ncbi:LysR family transcriptional regulator ArgP [Agrococcus jejuensis]|uniref:LysR family transcriptional regulator ArgP n=1 Tax=Agrococcus jejuensis TaxID=399736 RepID=UPI00119DF86F|nr:LysR family transcriptional regulator ArgP [Agrococcus jejuensis]